MKIDSLIKVLEYLKSNLTIKSDYSEELETLDNLESDAKVLLYLNGDRWRINDLLNDISQFREWIKQELEH